MSFLKSVTKGKIKRPYTIFLYGIEGTGKTTFASQAPDPVFIATENGTDNLYTSRGALQTSLESVKGALTELADEPHDYKTLVIDTMNGLEGLLHKEMISREPKANTIMDTKGGYGKGLLYASSQLESIIPLLDKCRDKRNMNIILIAHTAIKDFSDPSVQESYQKYRVNMDPRAADKFKQWVDCVLFATPETFVSEDQRTKKMRASSLGDSIAYTQARAGWDAKNRYGLPLKIDLNWFSFVDAVEKANPLDTKTLNEEIDGLLEITTDEELKAAVIETRAKAPDNPQFLTRIKEKLMIRLAPVQA